MNDVKDWCWACKPIPGERNTHADDCVCSCHR